MDLGFEHESFGVYEQVTLSAFDLLAAIVTTLLSSHSGRLYRLAIYNPSCRLGVPLEANPHPLAQGRVHPLPGPVQAELSEAMVDAAPGWEVVGKQAPGAAAPYDIEDGVDDLAQRVDARTPCGFGSGQVRFEVAPFGIR